MMGQIISRVRWLGLAILWSGFLLGCLSFFASSHSVPTVLAAPQESTDENSTIAFSSAAYTVSEGAGAGIVLLVVAPPISTPVTVTVSSGNLEAEASLDYEGLRQSVVISPSEPTYTLSLTLIDDLLVEADEQLQLTLSNIQGVEPGGITQTVVTIEDNDVTYIGLSDVSAEENDDSLALVITQSLTSTLESQVNLQTVTGTAVSPNDYTAISTTVTIPPGILAVTVSLFLHDDDEVEGTENLTVRLDEPVNAQLANMTATVTIHDDDMYPELSAQTAEASESDGILPFVVTLSAAWPQTVTVEYSTTNGSAIAPDDYITTSGVLTFVPGIVTATVEVPLQLDEIEEVDENFFLLFANPVEATMTINEIEGIIRDKRKSSLFLPGVLLETEES